MYAIDSIKRRLLEGIGSGLNLDSPFEVNAATGEVILHADSIRITKTKAGFRIGYFWRGNEIMWNECEELVLGHTLTLSFNPVATIF